MEEKRVIRDDLGEIPFLLVRKDVKNINLRVDRSGVLTVSAPVRTPIAEIERVLAEKSGWIRKNLSRQAAKDEKRIGGMRGVGNAENLREGGTLLLFGKEYRLRLFRAGRTDARIENGEVLVFCRNPDSAEAVFSALERFREAELRQVVELLMKHYYPYFADVCPHFPTVRYRRMTSRWGSCLAAEGIVTFNLALSAVPLCCVESVVVHELTHLRHPDHSPAFHAEMERILPDEKKRTALLRRYE